MNGYEVFQYSPRRIRKDWGWTREVFFSRECSVHLLDVEPGGICSKHYHADKFNLFYVQSGVILVTVWNGTTQQCRLHTGERLDVPPGIVHQFEAIESGVVQEVYWPRPGAIVRREDIVRLTEEGAHATATA